MLRIPRVLRMGSVTHPSLQDLTEEFPFLHSRSASPTGPSSATDLSLSP